MSCHAAIYDEWKQSTHATALQGIQYLAELAKEGSPKWLCLNCHTPLQDQREDAEGNGGARVMRQAPTIAAS